MSDLAFGLQITVLGMGLVFGLLALLWALLALAGRLEARAAPPRAVTASQPPAPSPQPSDDAALMESLLTAPPGEGVGTVQIRGPGAAELPPEAAAAIATAVIAHAANRRRQAAPETRSYAPGSLLFASRWVIAGRTRQNRGHRGERRS